jgi:hypothetical protein
VRPKTRSAPGRRARASATAVRGVTARSAPRRRRRAARLHRGRARTPPEPGAGAAGPGSGRARPPRHAAVPCRPRGMAVRAVFLLAATQVLLLRNEPLNSGGNVLVAHTRILCRVVPVRACLQSDDRRVPGVGDVATEYGTESHQPPLDMRVARLAARQHGVVALRATRPGRPFHPHILRVSGRGARPRRPGCDPPAPVASRL